MSAAAELLSANGPLPKLLPGHESRPDQEAMAAAVEEQLAQGGTLVVEAGTGVGKSLAYLLPAALWARANDKRVVVSTNTIPLQDQLLKKDLPLVQRLLQAAGFSSPLRFRQLVGRGNYLCEARLNHAQAEVMRGDALFDDEGALLAQVSRWNEAEGHEGRRQELPFGLPARSWERVRADADNCMTKRCKHYDRCHFFKSRSRAGSGEILVVNHALLLADLVARDGEEESTGVLPDWSVAILDEGHHLEDVSRRAFTIEVSRRSLNRYLDRLMNPRARDRGELATLEVALSQVAGNKEALAERIADRVHEDLPYWVTTVRDAAATLWEVLIDAYGRDEPNQTWINDDAARSETWLNCTTAVTALKTSLSQLCHHIKGVLGSIEAESLAEENDGLRSAAMALGARMRRLADARLALAALEMGDDEGCTWVEVGAPPKDRRWPRDVGLFRAPIEVSELLQKLLFTGPHATVLTSATLTTGPQDFRMLLGQTGLGAMAPGPRLLSFGSPFNHQKQALLATLPDLPDPRQERGRAFEAASNDVLAALIRASEGGALILFTSHRQMRSSFEALAPGLLAEGYGALLHGQRGISRSELLTRFRSHPKAVLFGTDTFWEGVDVPGEALRLVVLTRLPFKPPTEPVTRARHARLEAQGGRPFVMLTLPEAILRVRQGYGRLLRNRADRGAVVILDPRIEALGYGRRFFEALPPAKRLRGSLPEILQAVADVTGVEP